MKKKAKSTPKIVPMGDRILIKPLADNERGTVLPSGIIIPDTVEKEKTDRGKVIEVGPGRQNDNGDLIPMNVSKGDVVLFQWGEKVEVDGDEYYIVGESSVLAIIK